MQAANTLHLKLNLKKHPYSSKLIALRLVATFADSFSPRHLAAQKDLPYPLSQQQLALACASLQSQFRAASYSLQIAPACTKHLVA